MKKIAIISYFHYEASLCLAKHIAEKGISVDCYIIVDMHHDKGMVPGIDYHRASKFPGLIRLTPKTAPEIYDYSSGIPLDIYLFRIVSYSSKLLFFNKIVFKRALSQIRKRKYDAINIVGQWPWVEYIHDGLLDQNITHSFHEVGNHFTGNLNTPLLDKVIKDRSKVILHSKSTLKRFELIQKADLCNPQYIPFGKFETLLLYRKYVNMSIDLDKNYPTFLFYGYFRPYKGLDTLAAACKLLEEQKVRYNIIIAGSGYDENLDYFRNLKNCTVINKFLSDDEMMHLNEISDVVLLPYKSASQSGIVPTSFMFSNPIIATKVGALPEVIKNNENGLLVEPNNPSSFANSMKLLATDINVLATLKNGANNFGNHDEYDWNNIASKTISVLMHNLSDNNNDEIDSKNSY